MTDLNQKSFTLYKNVSKAFTLIGANLSLAATFIFRNIMKIRGSYTMKFIENSYLNGKIKKIKMTFSSMKLSTKITQPLSIKRIKGAYSIKETLKALSTIKLYRVVGSYVFILAQKSSLTMSMHKLVSSFSPTIDTFYTLLYFDPQTLSVLDALTLGEMDINTA